MSAQISASSEARLFQQKNCSFYDTVSVSSFSLGDDSAQLSTAATNKDQLTSSKLATPTRFSLLKDDKENTHQVRKALNDKNNDMTDLMSLLQKVEIPKELDEEVTLKEKQNPKTYKTCRYVPLRKNNHKDYTLTEEFSIKEELTENPPTYRKGQDFQDQQQITIKDVYKMHVLGIDLDSKKQISQNPQVWKSNNMFTYDYKENFEKKLPGSSDYMLQDTQNILNPNHILKTYEELVNYKSNFGVQLERKINKIPFKVLDAPSLQDDFYLNLIDWSSSNILAVALSSCVYLWSASNNKVIKFCDFGSDDMVCSLVWSPNGQQLAIGTGQGELHIFDQVKMKRLSVLEGHSARIGSLAWSNSTLCSGSKDRSILVHDLRTAKAIQKLEGHKQEVCGLKWSPDEDQLASGGNDNKLMVWRIGCERAVAKFGQHQAAVKALAWSPHKHGLLVSGGGTADRSIRFFNTLTTQQIEWIDTGSQVCNLAFSKNINEFISTHGYSMNQIVCWKYPSLEKVQNVVTLTGHSQRVLFLAMSPDGETIVTGAGDETLRFWNVFPKKEEKQLSFHSNLAPDYKSLR